jgi:hypothetical protein
MSLDKCLKDLEKIRKKALRRLAENCTSEFMIKAATYEIQTNYRSASEWIRKIFFVGMYVGNINLSTLEQHNKEDVVGDFSSHLYYHLTQIRMLAKRH